MADNINRPKVSILVPTWNRSAYLRETLDSIFKQSFTDFEVIVVDNCSTDDTAKVVASWSDPRLKYIYNEINIGAVGNYNKALRTAQGEYICLFSDDDIMSDSNNIALKVEILEKMPGVGLVHSSINTIDKTGNIVDGNWAATTNNWELLIKNPLMKGSDAYYALYYKWNFITMSTVMIRSSILIKNKIEFNNQLVYLIDWALWLQLSLFSDFYYIDKPLISYRRHNTNESALMKIPDFFNELVVLKMSLLSLFSKSAPFTDIRSIVTSTNQQLGKKGIIENFIIKAKYGTKSILKKFLFA